MIDGEQETDEQDEVDLDDILLEVEPDDEAPAQREPVLEQDEPEDLSLDGDLDSLLELD